MYVWFTFWSENFLFCSLSCLPKATFSTVRIFSSDNTDINWKKPSDDQTLWFIQNYEKYHCTWFWLISSWCLSIWFSSCIARTLSAKRASRKFSPSGFSKSQSIFSPISKEGRSELLTEVWELSLVVGIQLISYSEPQYSLLIPLGIGSPEKEHKGC